MEHDHARVRDGWYKTLDAATKADTWGQMVEAVDAYERCVSLPPPR
jgi:hypothetical protein